jgi:hypothetical protein
MLDVTGSRLFEGMASPIGMAFFTVGELRNTERRFVLYIQINTGNPDSPGLFGRR